MFTGIIEELGEVAELTRRAAVWRLVVKADRTLEGSEPGASLAVNGVCLTVVDRAGSALAFDLAPETLRVTALGDLGPGEPVNLERPLRFGAPLGGHLVLGHVDGVGTVRSVTPEAEAARIRVAVGDPALERYLVPKGSVAVDGVSLTVTAVTPGGFEVMLVPHTLTVTSLGRRRAGERVNLEVDLIGKYLFRFVQSDRRIGDPP